MKYDFIASFEFIENNCVLARVPNIKGCITTGNNVEEALTLIKDALCDCLIVLENENEDIPNTPCFVPFKDGVLYTILHVDTDKVRNCDDCKHKRKRFKKFPCIDCLEHDRFEPKGGAE